MEYVHIRLSAKLVLRELAGHRSDKQSPERIGGVVSAVVSIREMLARLSEYKGTIKLKL